MTEKASELREQLKKRIEMQPTETLKQVCVHCMTDFQDGTDAVMEMSLRALQCRLTSEEFVAFCEELEDCWMIEDVHAYGQSNLNNFA